MVPVAKGGAHCPLIGCPTAAFKDSMRLVEVGFGVARIREIFESGIAIEPLGCHFPNVADEVGSAKGTLVFGVAIATRGYFIDVLMVT